MYIKAESEDSTSLGSGFVYKIDNGNCYIITSYHVIENYDTIYVINKNNEREIATIIGYDEYMDLALLMIKNSLGLKEAIIGDSNKIKVNDKISYIESPVNKTNNINYGYIKSANKNITFQTTHGVSKLKLIEVSANIANGNSGGAIINENKEVVGLISLKYKNNNISYAMPINYAVKYIKLIENNELKRPSIGASFTNTTNKTLINEKNIIIGNVSGIVILDINNYSPLLVAGLKKGDVITGINGIIVKNVVDFEAELYKYKPGDEITLEYYTDNTYTVKIKLN